MDEQATSRPGGMRLVEECLGELTLVEKRRLGPREHAPEPLSFPHRSDNLLFPATSSELLPVNISLNLSWVCSDGPKLYPLVVNHKVIVCGNAQGRYVACHGACTVRIHRIRAFNGHVYDVAVCVYSRGCGCMPIPVEGLPTDLTKRAGQ